MRRLIAGVLAALTALNGSMMLFAGPSWYASVPGVSETGPFNPHFVQDIGAPFLVAGLALADTRMILSGALPAAALALAVDGVLAIVELTIAPAHRRKRFWRTRTEDPDAMVAVTAKH